MTKKNEKKMMVFGIGASAGGLESIQQLFDHIPSDTGACFVIIQHLSPDFKSLMPELLSKHTKMKIFTAEDKQVLSPNCIYLNQRNKNLHVKSNKLYLLDKGPKNNLNLPIDIFFHTLGEEFKDSSVGIVLSGTGSDGSRGIKTIKEQGGTIIVQDPTSAQFDGMPNSALSTNLVDFSLPPNQIADLIIKLSSQIPQATTPKDIETQEELMLKILDEVNNFTGIDFKKYKKSTLFRRIEKRVSVTGEYDLSAYYKYLIKNSNEKKLLCQDFLIGVTRFFRDAEAFDYIKSKAIPLICNRAVEDELQSLRVWVPACSTGEEVYSLAVLLDEYIRDNRLSIDYKIFATDVDERAINIASRGVYNANVINEIDRKYLDQFFVKMGDKIQVNKRIREKIVFSCHNILTDPPFIRVDMISCRNMLIYMDNLAQRQILKNFQFSLNIEGILFLGNSESLGEISPKFKTLNSKWKIFQNISGSKKPSFTQNNTLRNSIYETRQKAYKSDFVDVSNINMMFYKYLSSKYSPATIFIDADFNIVFIMGEAGNRLIPKEGVFQNNILKLVDQSLSAIIRNAIRRLKSENADIKVENIRVKNMDSNVTFDVTFHKPLIKDTSETLFMIQFSENKVVKDPETKVIKFPVEEFELNRLADLENELAIAKHELQNAIEELETSNEELQSSNEELMASNEELQSTNEELQSVNEELYTVNSELQEKNHELRHLNNDVNNLLNGTDIGTLFLDRELRIRKFTPSLQKHFDLNQSDIGRSISSFTSTFSEFERLNLFEDCKIVMDDLKILEKPITDDKGRTFVRKISPFVSSEKVIEGVVVTFTEVTKIKETEDELNNVLIKYKSLFEHMPEGFANAKIIYDEKNKPVDWEYISANDKYKGCFEIDVENIRGARATDLIPEQISYDKGFFEFFVDVAITQKSNNKIFKLKKSNKIYQINAFSPNKGEWAATFLDVTAIRASEEKYEKKNSQLIKIQEIFEISNYYYNPSTRKFKLLFEGNFEKQAKVNLNNKSIDSLISIIGIEKGKELVKKLEEVQIKQTNTKFSFELLNKETKIVDVYQLHGYYMHQMNQDSIWITIHNVTDELRILTDDVEKYVKEKQIEPVYTNLKSILKDLEQDFDSLVKSNKTNQIKEKLSYVLEMCEMNNNLKHEQSLKTSKLEAFDLKEENLSQLIPNSKNLKVTHTYDSSLQEKLLLVNIKSFKKLMNLILKFLAKDLKVKSLKVFYSYKSEIFTISFIFENNLIPVTEKVMLLDSIPLDISSSNLQSAILETEDLGFQLDLCPSPSNDLRKINIVIPIIDSNFLKLNFKETDFNDRYKKINGLKILVAEDIKAMQFLYKKIFENFEVDLVMVNNGEEVLDKVKTAKKDFDIIFLDVRMPIKNGKETLVELRQMNKNLKIIMQSMYEDQDIRNECLSLGANDYIIKPLDDYKVLNAVLSSIDEK